MHVLNTFRVTLKRVYHIKKTKILFYLIGSTSATIRTSSEYINLPPVAGKRKTHTQRQLNGLFVQLKSGSMLYFTVPNYNFERLRAVLLIPISITNSSLFTNTLWVLNEFVASNKFKLVTISYIFSKLTNFLN